MTLSLNKQELSDAASVARMRLKPGYSDQGWNLENKTQFERGVEGVVGELAVASLFNTDIDRRVLPGGDTGADVVAKEHTIAVRYTRVKGGGFIQDGRGIRADFGILCVEGDEDSVEIAGVSISPEVRIAGFVSRPTFMLKAEEKTFYNRPALYLPQFELRPIEHLMLYLSEYKPAIKRIYASQH